MFTSLLSSKSSSDVRDDYQKGPNMSRTAAQKIYGWFVEQMQSINPDKSTREILSTYPSPTIVMIGGESTGKSATIENITKVPIFPTDTGVCTRCPIKVSLIPEQIEGYSVTFRKKTQRFTGSNKELLKIYIKAYFDEIAASCPSGYSNEEISVTIERKDVMRIDIVDLPGMVSYPAEAKQFTANLCQQYINNQNNFILCVANSTIPRLTSYEPIARIIESKACKRTVLVLTMADKLEPMDYEPQLIQRILGVSDELRSHDFSAVCAVINRSSAVANTLDEQTQNEQQWFEQNILQLLRKHGGAQQLQYADKIQAHAGINKLLFQVNEKFESYIKTQWVPRTVQEIKSTVAQLRASAKKLGDPITAMNLAEFQGVFARTHEVIVSTIISKSNITSLFQAIDTNRALALEVEEVDADVLVAKIEKWFTSWVITDTLSPAVQSQYQQSVRQGQRDHWGKCMEPPYCLQRFAGFFAEYKSDLLTKLRTAVAPNLKSLYPVILSNQFTNVPANVTLITAVLNTHMGRLRTGPKPLTLRVGLVESCAAERKALEAKIAMHDGVEQKLQDIIKV